mmetsp:Transcript_25857/g.77647  ORF Transcript_25857/g.77647 Transcript_25857/m.77647 type:complete len:275 (-) Transcript_25857:1483-2307(-)
MVARRLLASALSAWRAAHTSMPATLGVTVSVRLCVFFLVILPGLVAFASVAFSSAAGASASAAGVSSVFSAAGSSAFSAGSSAASPSGVSVALASVEFASVALSAAASAFTSAFFFSLLGSGGGASTSYSSTTETSALDSDVTPDESKVNESCTLGRGKLPEAFCLAMSAAKAAMPEMLYMATVFGVPGGRSTTSSYASSQTTSASWWKAMVRGLAPRRAPFLKRVARLCQSSSAGSPSFFFVPPLKKPMRPPPSVTEAACASLVMRTPTAKGE